MKYVLLAVLLLSALPLSAQSPSMKAEGNLITVRRVTAFDDSKPTMNSDKKIKLQAIAGFQAAVNPCFFLDVGVRLRPLARNAFQVREEMGDTKTAQAQKWMKVNYDCALVEVLEGAHRGRKGWVVLSREVVDRYVDVWIGPEPEPEGENPSR